MTTVAPSAAPSDRLPHARSALWRHVALTAMAAGLVPASVAKGVSFAAAPGEVPGGVLLESSSVIPGSGA